jgi:hypothetical protein
MMGVERGRVGIISAPDNGGSSNRERKRVDFSSPSWIGSVALGNSLENTFLYGNC